MNRFYYITSIAVFFMLLQSCTGTRRFGTTIERDENNPCQVNMIIQVAIEGTDDDVTMVKNALEDCYGKECFIPCPGDSLKGCKTKITVVVKKYSSLKEDETAGFHYVQMIDDDGLPSNAYLGTPNNGASSGTWRRNQPPGVYCHEVLHFCGLPDKYCSRLYDPVTDSARTELVCDPPPDPNGICCAPSASHTRCSSPCTGHEHDLMANIYTPLSCDNIMDVLKGAGLNNCPPECCASDKTFTRPPDEVYIIPGYYHFGDKNTKFGSIGGSVGYTKQIGTSLGVTIEGGYYLHSDKDNSYKQTSGLMHITGGITYRVTDPPTTEKGISISTHALFGVSRYTQKTNYGGNTLKDDATSLHFNIGAAVDLQLNRSWAVRLLQADYAPTFFYEATQHNYRISAGLVHRLGR